jgi:hypothetical protein
MQILIDYNLEGDAPLLFTILYQGGWVELFELEFTYLRATPLSVDSDDSTIWRYVQENEMLLLTYNRNATDETSLTETIRRENTLESLPVLTIANPLRMKEASYRQTIAERLVEILLDLPNYLGTGRLYLS